MDEPNDVDELDEALTACGFTTEDDQHGNAVAKLTGTVTIEVVGGPMGMFFVRTTFPNGKTLHTTFSWDDIEDAFPWKAWVAGPTDIQLP
jgi:hypothetical protein